MTSAVEAPRSVLQGASPSRQPLLPLGRTITGKPSLAPAYALCLKPTPYGPCSSAAGPLIPTFGPPTRAAGPPAELTITATTSVPLIRETISRRERPPAPRGVPCVVRPSLKVSRPRPPTPKPPSQFITL